MHKLRNSLNLHFAFFSSAIGLFLWCLSGVLLVITFVALLLLSLVTEVIFIKVKKSEDLKLVLQISC